MFPSAASPESLIECMKRIESLIECMKRNRETIAGGVECMSQMMIGTDTSTIIRGPEGGWHKYKHSHSGPLSSIHGRMPLHPRLALPPSQLYPILDLSRTPTHRLIP